MMRGAGGGKPEMLAVPRFEEDGTPNGDGVALAVDGNFAAPGMDDDELIIRLGPGAKISTGEIGYLPKTGVWARNGLDEGAPFALGDFHGLRSSAIVPIATAE